MKPFKLKQHGGPNKIKRRDPSGVDNTYAGNIDSPVRSLLLKSAKDAGELRHILNNPVITQGRDKSPYELQEEDVHRQRDYDQAGLNRSGKPTPLTTLAGNPHFNKLSERVVQPMAEAYGMGANALLETAAKRLAGKAAAEVGTTAVRRKVPSMMQRVFNDTMKESTEADWDALRGMNKRANRYLYNMNNPEGNSEVYKNIDHLFKERDFNRLLPKKMHDGPIPSEAVEKFLDDYHPDNPFADWSEKRINKTMNEIIKDHDAGNAMYPNQYSGGIEGSRYRSRKSFDAFQPERSGSTTLGSKWDTETPWREWGDEMKGLMERDGFDPTKEADVTKYRKVYKQNHGEHMMDGLEQVKYKDVFGHIHLNQNAGSTDAYDFGSDVLQNYAAMQQQRQQQQEQQPQEEPLEEQPEAAAPEQQEAGDPDKFTIPDADYFARKQFEYTGQRDIENELDEMRNKIALLDNSYNTLLEGSINYDNLLGNDGSEDEEDDGSGYSGPAPDYSTRANPLSRGNSMAARHNNPGNIKYGDFAAGYGAIKGDRSPEGDGTSYAHFPSTQAGLAAMQALLQNKTYQNLSVQDAMDRYSNHGTYSNRIAAAFNNRKMKDLTPSEMDKLVKMMVVGEDAGMAASLGIKQSGGQVPVASHPSDKYHGLNLPYLDELLIQNSGYNKYRGLDDGSPVHLYDEQGAFHTLHGPDDMATLYGNVYEHR